MNKGILIFAFNGDFNYQELALKSAKRAKHFLNLPVSLVTDSVEDLTDEFYEIFDKIILDQDNTTQERTIHDGTNISKKYIWKNGTRYNCYELSPYDETLVIDADYIVNSSFLLNCFNLNKDFLIYKNSYDLAGWRTASEFENINQWSIPFYWATVVYFKKTAINKLFFNLVGFIKENWNYYRLLYQILEKKYRNDYSFSIALHILHGYTANQVDLIPGKIYYVTDRDILIDLDDTSFTFLVEKEAALGDFTPLKISNIDVHIMNKHSILRILK